MVQMSEKAKKPILVPTMVAACHFMTFIMILIKILANFQQMKIFQLWVHSDLPSSILIHIFRHMMDFVSHCQITNTYTDNETKIFLLLM